jgi:small-conductance mechanosensitive channel
MTDRMPTAALPPAFSFAEFLRNPYALSALLTLGIVVVATAVWLLVSRRASRDVKDENTAHRIRRNILSMTMLLAIVALAAVWASHVRMELAAGLIGAGIALAMQNVILCLAGWFSLALRRIYDVGDRIEIDGTLGDVLDIGLMHTTLLEVNPWEHGQQSTGRVVTIPNRAIFISHVFNFTKGFPFVWNDLLVNVTFESNWQEAKQIMLRLAERNAEQTRSEVAAHIRRMRRKLPIRFEHLTPIVYNRIADSGVELALRFLTPVKQRRGIKSELCDRILEAFAGRDDIQLAYPTQRITGVGTPGPVVLGPGATPTPEAEPNDA